MLILQLELSQPTVRVAVGDDANDLGVVAGFLRQVFDGFARCYRLGHALGGGVDAVCRNFPYLSARRGKIEIRVTLRFGRAVHRKIGHGVVAIVDIHFTQRVLNGVGRGCKTAAQAQNRGHDQKHGQEPFSHD
ncbi:hypothetical protein SDC9_83833 [bioreactor metagenome]|uniref:Uncharacterized protein n=1 Tax=bioreactor metagenome TaxID=1076179 RepID=A0A644Z8M2_9ZZZZ